uniref:Uncharacterized protein n=1 Tax=Oryza glumipatula TaxID=40148 RepID=A0A0D9ZYH6_9ORYZ
MAELASGAVSSLLGLLQKEAQLLGHVGSDVEFIREEMESMNSFLEHLSRKGHLAGGHDKQVRTWMKQVRDLAHDCSNCIDDYLRSGDLAVHLARGGVRRYIWWTYWLVRKMHDQQNAALRLRELRDRVSDVGKRRLRYGVEIPSKAAVAAQIPSSSTLSQGGAAVPEAAEDEDDDDDDILNQGAAAMAGSPDLRRRALEPHTLEDFCAEKLFNWVNASREQKSRQQGPPSIPSISIVALDADASTAAAQGALELAAAHFDKSVSINLQALHHPWDLPLLPQEILFYILFQCKQQGTDQGKDDDGKRREALDNRRNTYIEIWTEISKINIHDKIEEVKSKIGEVSGTTEEVENKNTEETKRLKATADIPLDKSLGMLHQALCLMLNKKSPNMIGRPLEDIMQKTAMMLKQHMEAVVPEPSIQLDVIQYQDILQEVFLDSKPPQVQETSTSTATTLGEDHIKEILNNHKITLNNHRIALDIIRELLHCPQLPEGNSVKEQAKGVLLGGCDQNSAIDTATTETEETKAKGTTTAIEESKEKVGNMSPAIKFSLFIKGIVDKIKAFLESERTLFILIDDSKYISQWEGIKNALNLLQACSNGSAVVVITKNSYNAKEFCTLGEPITCSLVGLYHDIVLKITSQRESEGGNNNSQIFHDILEKCDPNEYCMRMFAHALYANPNRSDEELHRLHGSLQVSENSMDTYATIAKMIFKFSYRDLPREHKTCLLYLAIFPEGHKIKRSTLIERWAIEELITKEDWPTVVRHGKRCFEALIDRWLVTPVELSAAGKVKRCKVDGLVHDFITQIAKKEHILDMRLSQLRARHFSIFSGLRLRASDTIDTVVEKLPRYLHKLRLLKLLDLEECQHLDKNHLKAICSMILRLKYLSLRKTNAADLPREINNLHELEVLDIRQTKVSECATRGIVLLKLRRLLAGQVDPSTSHEVVKPLCSAVHIPRKISKMENMEVLSNVKASSRNGAELKEIRKLGQLRKVGVVINNNKDHLTNLLWAISDLTECLQSLSVTIDGTRNEGTPTNQELLPDEQYKHLINPPKVLESLSIDGFTDIVQLLTLFAKGSSELAKVTLRRTLLKKNDLVHITTLSKLCCVRLRQNAYTDKKLTFEKEEFPHLKNFLVEQLDETDMINFKKGAAPELEKIVLFRTRIKHLFGVGALPNLKELELKENEYLVLLPEAGTVSAIPVILEDWTDSTEIIVHKDGATSAEQSTLTFKKEEFKHLKYFLVEGRHKQTGIKFEGGASEIEKIVLSNTNIKSLVGVNGLSKLREIDLKGNGTLLSLFATANHITKVTLSDTFLKQDDLQFLAKKPKLCWLLLLHNSYVESHLTFNKDEFPKLKFLIIKSSNISDINFAKESACKLEKITWTFTELKSLCGIDNLVELKELEFNGESVPVQVRRDISAHNKKLIHNKT